MGQMISNEENIAVQTDRSMIVPWRMYLLIVSVGILVIGFVAYGFYKGERMYYRYSPTIECGNGDKT